MSEFYEKYELTTYYNRTSVCVGYNVKKRPCCDLKYMFVFQPTFLHYSFSITVLDDFDHLNRKSEGSGYMTLPFLVSRKKQKTL